MSQGLERTQDLGMVGLKLALEPPHQRKLGLRIFIFIRRPVPRQVKVLRLRCHTLMRAVLMYF
jgi:hypothetical protein